MCGYQERVGSLSRALGQIESCFTQTHWNYATSSQSINHHSKPARLGRMAGFVIVVRECFTCTTLLYNCLRLLSALLK